MDNHKRLSVPLSKTLHRRVFIAAKKQRQSMTQWILTAIEEKLRQLDPKK